MSTLDDIRKKLQAMDTRKGGNENSSYGDTATYALWNLVDGGQSTLRFLPDGDESNTFFWAERQLINLTFPGVKGGDEHKEITIKVPCVEMWDGKNTCPILNEVRPMWKDKSLEDLARKYWVKKSYYMQGFVKQDGMAEQTPPANPIRKFVVSPQIFKLIQSALMDTEMENNPVDYINGTDFIVAKTSKGGFADYSTSKWARKETSLTAEQQDAISQYGLAKLSEYLPTRPTAAHLNAMHEMFQASIDGELYDPARWAQYYKPFGFDSAGQSAQSGAVSRASANPMIKSPAPASTITEEDIEMAEEGTVSTPAPAPSAAPATGASKSPQEILALLRNRNK